MNTLIELDGRILLWIQGNLRIPLLNPIMDFITHLGDGGFIWIALTLFLLFRKNTRVVGVVAAGSLAMNAIITNLVLKPLVDRIRPYEVLADLELLISKQTDSSFPSGHTAASFAVAVVCLKLLPRGYGISAMVLAVIIAFSRLYVGVHYPLDVLGGIVIGMGCALVGCMAYRKWKENTKIETESKIE